MQLADFLQRVLPSQGPYFHSKLSKSGQWSDHLTTGLGPLEQAIHKSDLQQADCYFSTASFKSPTGRTQNNVAYKRTWYIDVDYGDTHDSPQYPDKKSALAAIKQARINGLPAPVFLVHSGHGFQLHWCSDEPVTPATWGVLARALVNCCAKTGLKIDKGISEDTARVLRAPGTRNWKVRTDPRLCDVMLARDENYALEDWEAAMQPFLTEPVGLATPPPQAPSAPTDELSDLETGLARAQVAFAAHMVPQCPLMADMQAHNGLTEPGVVWHKVIHTLAFCADGADFIHSLSTAHPTYDYDATERRYAHALRAKESSGPTTCAKLKDASNDSHCSDCPFNGRIKSPIVLGYRIQADMPLGWRNEGGCLEKWDGEEWGHAAHVTIDAVEAVFIDKVMHVRVTASGKEVDCPESAFMDNRNIYTAFARYGITLRDYARALVRDCIMAWLEQLRQRKQVTNTTAAFGWRDNGFAVGSKLYAQGGGEATAFQRDRAFAGYYEPKGELGPWQECAQYLLDNSHPALWCAVGSAFAAPLMPFTGVTGALLAITSPESGTGKTTSLRTAEAVWGDPVNTIAAVNDTVNSVTNRMGTLNNLPVYWDEIRGHHDVSQFVRLVFRLSQGREKARLDSQIQQRSTNTWETLLVCASNEGVVGYIKVHAGGTDAGALRVLELEVPKLNSDLSPSKARRFFSQVRSHYGQAGVIYAKWLVDNAEIARKYVTYFDDKITQAVKATHEERFWVGIAAAILAGMKCAELAELLAVDIKKLFLYLVRSITAMRQTTNRMFKTGSENAIALVQDFMREMQDNSIISETQPRRGRNTGNPEAASYRTPTAYRVGVKDKTLRIAKAVFEHWVIKNHPGTSPDYVFNKLKAIGTAEKPCNLDVGTYRQATGVKQTCLHFDLTNPGFTILDSTGHFSDPGSPDSSQDSEPQSDPLPPL